MFKYCPVEGRFPKSRLSEILAMVWKVLQQYGCVLCGIHNHTSLPRFLCFIVVISLFDCPSSERSHLCIPTVWYDLIPLLYGGEKQAYTAPGSGSVNKALGSQEQIVFLLGESLHRPHTESTPDHFHTVSSGRSLQAAEAFDCCTPLLCIAPRCTLYNTRLPQKSFRIGIWMSALLRCLCF